MYTMTRVKLQFFGDPAPAPAPNPTPEPNPAPTPTPTPAPAPDETLASITKHYEAEIASRDRKIADLQETIGVLCGGKPAPTPGDPAPKNGGTISPTLKALLR